MIVTDKLPDGVEYEGQTYCEFSLREHMVCDTVELFESADGERAGKSDAFYGVAIIAQRLTITGIPAEAITADLVMHHMTQADFNVVMEAGKRLEEMRRTFRRAAQAAAAAADSAAETGI